METLIGCMADVVVEPATFLWVPLVSIPFHLQRLAKVEVGFVGQIDVFLGSIERAVGGILGS